MTPHIHPRLPVETPHLTVVDLSDPKWIYRYTEALRVKKWGREFNSKQRIKAYERSLPDAQSLINSCEVGE